MSLTNIGDQRTPGRPSEITFAAELGLPNANATVVLIGQKDAASGDAEAYKVTTVNNVSDLTQAEIEANAKFGEGSEAALMVIAAVRANAAVGRSTFPAIRVISLPAGVTNFGPNDEALTALKKVRAEYAVSPFDAKDVTLRTKLRDAIAEMSGAQRVHNNQFGSFGVVFNMSEDDPGNLDEPDSRFLICATLRDTGTGPDANPYSVGEYAAALAGVMGSNTFPFNPQHDFVLGGAPAPKDDADWYSVGGGLESETILQKGWTPLRVLPNGDVAIVRAVTSRTTVGDGVTKVTSYYDVTDYNVLYYWRLTLFTRLNQPDMKNVKASAETAISTKSEIIRLMKIFEDEQAFQNVDALAKKLQVERSKSDRHRFDVRTPVNVVPGLSVIASNTQATTEGDELSI